MSWIAQLYETYENCKDAVGAIQPDQKTPLLPIAHSTQNAQVEVVLNTGGVFESAAVVNKDDAVTIIPCTEDSASRSGKAVFPHPLCDKLQYIAGDYRRYGGEKGEEFYKKYLEQLEGWCASPYGCYEVRTILSYLKKGMLISDLVACKVLCCGEDDKLLEKWTGSKEKTPKIFTALNAGQSEAFVRFIVRGESGEDGKVWKSKQVWESYINYCLSLKEDTDLCYVTGKAIPCSDKHPAKIRNTADKAKLISANDSSGFTYRGRFSEDTQVVRVGYVPSQEAHNALRWLIDRQGNQHGEQSIVAWGSKNEKVPSVPVDSFDFFSESTDNPPAPPQTQQAFALQLNKTISGYGKYLDTKAQVLIIAVDAATVGRLSITYYRELNGSEFLERIQRWHNGCAWLHNYKWAGNGVDAKGKPQNARTTFYGAPSPKDIAEVAYGKNCSDKLKKATVERLLACIIDGAHLPYDIVQSVVSQASRCAEIEWYDWEKALSIGCALVRKYYSDELKRDPKNAKFKEELEMSLDPNQKDRSYLFGRLLAIAQEIESWALYEADVSRETTAERMMHQFTKTPYKTWNNLYKALEPYKSRLGDKVHQLDQLMVQITDMLTFEDFSSTKPLDNVWLLGYSSQRQVLLEEKEARIARKKLKDQQAQQTETK